MGFPLKPADVRVYVTDVKTAKQKPPPEPSRRNCPWPRLCPNFVKVSINPGRKPGNPLFTLEPTELWAVSHESVVQ